RRESVIWNLSGRRGPAMPARNGGIHRPRAVRADSEPERGTDEGADAFRRPRWVEGQLHLRILDPIDVRDGLPHLLHDLAGDRTHRRRERDDRLHVTAVDLDVVHESEHHQVESELRVLHALQRGPYLLLRYRHESSFPFYGCRVEPWSRHRPGSIDSPREGSESREINAPPRPPPPAPGRRRMPPSPRLRQPCRPP